MLTEILPDLSAIQWIAIALVTLTAGTIQSATGFGFAVLSVPFFLLVLESLSAIQINIVLNLFNALVVAPKIWHLARAGFLKPLALGTVLGLPVGLAVFTFADLTHVKALVATVILIFAVRLILQSNEPHCARQPRKLSSCAVGGISGVLASALAMPGPPVLIYLAHFNLTKDQFRAVNLSLYIIAYAGALGLQATVGQMSLQTWSISLLLVPLAALGGVLGHRVSRWLSPQVFRALILATLIVMGVYILYQTLLT